MLNPEDRAAIDGLFERLAEVESRTPSRDPEAERLIEERMRRQPGAAYYLAQTVLVQQQALEAAEQRINDLEAEGSQRSRGGLFGGLFDDTRRQRPAPYRQDRYGDADYGRRRGPWERPAGGGFLAGAAQTAVGVAGGVLLGSAIGSLLGAGAASAAEPAAEDASADQSADAGDAGAADGAGAGDFGGSDFGGGDFGGFDMGGDF
jgi:uncharacterized protein